MSGKAIRYISGREHDMSTPFFYQWKQKDGGMMCNILKEFGFFCSGVNLPLNGGL